MCLFYIMSSCFYLSSLVTGQTVVLVARCRWHSSIGLAHNAQVTAKNKLTLKIARTISCEKTWCVSHFKYARPLQILSKKDMEPILRLGSYSSAPRTSEARTPSRLSCGEDRPRLSARETRQLSCKRKTKGKRVSSSFQVLCHIFLVVTTSHRPRRERRGASTKGTLTKTRPHYNVLHAMQQAQFASVKASLAAFNHRADEEGRRSQAREFRSALSPSNGRGQKKR